MGQSVLAQWHPCEKQGCAAVQTCPIDAETTAPMASSCGTLLTSLCPTAQLPWAWFVLPAARLPPARLLHVAMSLLPHCGWVPLSQAGGCCRAPDTEQPHAHGHTGCCTTCATTLMYKLPCNSQAFSGIKQKVAGLYSFPKDQIAL